MNLLPAQIWIRTFVLLTVLLSSCAKKPTETVPTTRLKSTPLRKILNGTTVSEAVYSHTGAIYYSLPGISGFYLQCTGTLIDRNHVLTAAHCFYDGNTQLEEMNPGVRFYFALQADPQSGIHPIEAESFEIHPLYDPETLKADLAIVTLTEGIVAKEQFYALLPPEAELAAQSEMRIVGFGTDKDENSFGKKREGLVRIHHVENDEIHHIIEDENSDHAICSGDSGGPGVVEIAGTKYLVGIASYISFFGTQSDPQHIKCKNILSGTHLDLRPYYSWISQRAEQPIISMLTEYQPRETMTVNFEGLGFTQRDWVAIAPRGASDIEYISWMYLPASSTSGSVQIEAPTRPGEYEVRVYLNNTYNRVYTLDFQVTSNVELSLSKEAFFETEKLTVQFSGLGLSDKDWIAIAKAGAPETSYVQWAYSNSASGSVTFESLPAGNYELRAFYNNGYERLGSISFTVETSLIIPKNTYRRNENIVVGYRGYNSSSRDWIAIAPVGAPESGYIAWSYVNADESAVSFESLSPGQYEIRGYRNNSFQRVATREISVAIPFSASKEFYAPNETIEVSYDDLDQDSKDWIAIAKHGSSMRSYLSWQYVNESGTLQFDALPPGTYELRAFLNNGFTLAASVVFTVQASLETSKNVYTTGETIEVQYDHFGQGSKNWVAISPVGSPEQAYLDWQYVNASNGTIEFQAPAPGKYEVRGYFNNSYHRVATSSVVTVE